MTGLLIALQNRPERVRPQIIQIRRIASDDDVAEASANSRKGPSQSIQRVCVDDLFDRNKTVGPIGPYMFEFLTLRNARLHQGKPPDEHEHFFNVSTRARYFAERQLFAVLDYPTREFLNQQYEVSKPSSKKSEA